MSPALNESSVLQHCERGNAVEIHNRIMFDFYCSVLILQDTVLVLLSLLHCVIDVTLLLLLLSARNQAMSRVHTHSHSQSHVLLHMHTHLYTHTHTHTHAHTHTHTGSTKSACLCYSYRTLVTSSLSSQRLYFTSRTGEGRSTGGLSWELISALLASPYNSE